MRGATMTTDHNRARGRQRLRLHGRRGPARRGFTLIELMVAIVIMVTGVLGLAGTAAMVSRMVGGAGQQTVAASVASSRFEMLRSVPCSQIVSGTATTRNMNEKWNATQDPTNGSLWVVTDTITYNAAGGRTPVLAFKSYIRCTI